MFSTGFVNVGVSICQILFNHLFLRFLRYFVFFQESDSDSDDDVSDLPQLIPVADLNKPTAAAGAPTLTTTTAAAAMAPAEISGRLPLAPLSPTAVLPPASRGSPPKAPTMAAAPAAPTLVPQATAPPPIIPTVC